MKIDKISVVVIATVFVLLIISLFLSQTEEGFKNKKNNTTAVATNQNANNTTNQPNDTASEQTSKAVELAKSASNKAAAAVVDSTNYVKATSAAEAATQASIELSKSAIKAETVANNLSSTLPNAKLLSADLNALKTSLSELKKDLNTAINDSKKQHNNLNQDLTQINNAKTNAITAIDNHKTEVIDDINKALTSISKDKDEAKKHKNQAQQAFEDTKGVVTKLKLFDDKQKTSAFTTLEQAYEQPVSNLWTSEGFDNITDGKPWTSSNTNNDLFNLTNVLSGALKNFHKAYYEYAACHYMNQVSNSDGTKKCTDLASKKNTFDTSVTALNTAITNATNAAKSLSSNTNNTNKVSQTDAESRHQALVALASQVERTRSDLDIKMNELLNKDGNKLMDSNKELTAVQYVTIGWSILAASALYYIFTELNNST